MSSLTNVQKAFCGTVMGLGIAGALMSARHCFLSIRAIQDTKRASTDQKTNGVVGNVFLGIANLFMMVGAGYATFLIGKTLHAGSFSLDDISLPFQIATFLFFIGLGLQEIVERAIFKGTKLRNCYHYSLIPFHEGTPCLPFYRGTP